MKELPRIVTAVPLDGARVRVTFGNGVEGTFDCTPYLSDRYWERLGNPAFFRQVRVECGTLCWPGDIDIDPEEIWEDCQKAAPV